MLTIPQIETLRRENPRLYEALRRIAAAIPAPGFIPDVDPSAAQFLARGSVPPTWNGGFTYMATPSSITWSWSGMQIYRADGTLTSVPAGTLTITSLTAGTAYFFYPYWVESAAQILWIKGGEGNPAIAQAARTNAAAQSQSLLGNIPLSAGAMTAATPTTGIAGGSGGGSGSCLRSGSVVLSRTRGTVPIESCVVSEFILARGDATRYGGHSAQKIPGPFEEEMRDSCRPSRTMGHRSSLHQTSAPRRGPERWTRIIRLEVLPTDCFLRLYFSNEESLDVTPHHVFTLADGSPMRAERLCLADVLVGRFSSLTLRRIEAIAEPSHKVLVGCTPFHEFYSGRIAATVLTHNWNFSS
jgi:hypothetical protein